MSPCRDHRVASTPGPMDTGTCPVCRLGLEDAVRRCPHCSTAHHPECWDYVGSCAVYSCSESARLTSRIIRSFAPRWNDRFRFVLGFSALILGIFVSFVILLFAFLLAQWGLPPRSQGTDRVVSPVPEAEGARDPPAVLRPRHHASIDAGTSGRTPWPHPRAHPSDRDSGPLQVADASNRAERLLRARVIRSAVPRIPRS